MDLCGFEVHYTSGWTDRCELPAHHKGSHKGGRSTWTGADHVLAYPFEVPEEDETE